MNLLRGILRSAVAGGFVIALIYLGGIWLLGLVVVWIIWHETRPMTKVNQAIRKEV